MTRALAIALLLAGCAGTATAPPAGPTVTLRVDLQPDEHGYSGADLAADLVDAADIFAPLGGLLVIDDGATAALRCATWDMGTSAAVQNSAGISVYCFPVVSHFSSAARRHLLAHELGHAFGLLHVEDPEALMYLDVGPGARLVMTADDLDEWMRVHGGER